MMQYMLIDTGADALNAPSETNNGFVYFIETWDSLFVKIGFSGSVPRRFDEIGLLLPKLRLLGYIKGGRDTEKWLHRKFASIRDRGEWFRKTDELREFISKLDVFVLPSDPEPEEPQPSVSSNAPMLSQSDIRSLWGSYTASLRKTIGRGGGRPAGSKDSKPRTRRKDA